MDAGSNIARPRAEPAAADFLGMGSTPQRRRGRMDDAALVAQARLPSRARSSGPSRSTKRARGASTMAGAMASEVPTMQPIISAKPVPSRGVGQRQRLGQAAGLVELDVDGVVEPDERGRGPRGRARFRRRRSEPAARSSRAAASRSAGRGCSTSASPASAQAARLAARFLRSSPHSRRRSGSLPGRPRDGGDSRRIAAGPPSFTLRIGRRRPAAASAMASGVSRLIV